MWLKTDIVGLFLLTVALYVSSRAVEDNNTFQRLEVEGESWRITVQLQHEVVFLFVSPSQPPSPPCGCSRTHCTTSRAPRTTVTLLMNFSITASRAGDTVAVVHGILFPLLLASFGLCGRSRLARFASYGSVCWQLAG